MSVQFLDQHDWGGSRRGAWVGDYPERDTSHPPELPEVVASFMAVGYETFYGRPILPSTVAVQLADDLRIFSVGRAIKDLKDVGEGIHDARKAGDGGTERPHVERFLDAAMWMADDVHERGLNMLEVVDVLEQEAAKMAGIAIRVHNERRHLHEPTETLSKYVWDAVMDHYTEVTDDHPVEIDSK